MKKLNVTSVEVIDDAAERLEKLRASLPNDTRGLFVMCAMLKLLSNSLPDMVRWAIGPDFLTALAVWESLGAPDFEDEDVPLELRDVLPGKWVQ